MVKERINEIRRVCEKEYGKRPWDAKQILEAMYKYDLHLYTKTGRKRRARKNNKK